MYKWILYFGASNHMTSHRVAFDIYEVIFLRNVYLGDDNVIKAIIIGFIVVEVMVKGNIKRISIKDVFHISKLQANLLSVSKLLLNELKVQFNLNEYIGKGLDGKMISMGWRFVRNEL